MPCQLRAKTEAGAHPVCVTPSCKVSLSRFTGPGLVAAACTFGLTFASTTTSEADSATVERIAGDTAHDYSAWAADPTTAGPALPPVGRSLFDFLVTETADSTSSNRSGTYQVPFPFSALIDRIRARLSNREFMGGIRMAIIPIGRSLQRVAAAPEFFKYPRTVIAVTGEPHTDAHDAGMLLKDRLYVAYVEKTEILEVISYNEAAGRFEFQLVKDYRAGAQPKVFYADRAICISCHQNHAPIFSQPMWGESNANGRVAEMLRAHGTDMRLPTQANNDFPNDVEQATIQANALVTLQAVWQRGCADERDPSQSRRCRAAAFAAILQYGLSGKRGFDSSDARYRNDFVATLSRVWSLKWPDGLRVARSSLPDRNPFAGATLSYGSGGPGESSFDWKSAANVPPYLDPLTPRSPHEIWRVADAMDTPRIIYGWVNSFAAEDFRTLDRHLVQRSVDSAVQRAVYGAQCTAVGSSSAIRLNLNCTADTRAEQSVKLVARIEDSGKGRIDWINFGPAGTLRDVDLTGSPVQSTNAGYVVHAIPKKTALATRLHDGRRLAGMEIRWSAEPVQDGKAQPIDAQFEAVVVDDFALVQAAIDRLLEKQPALFDNVPLIRARLMPALLAELGAPEESAPEKSPPEESFDSKKSWCCVDNTGIPTATLDVPEADAAVLVNEKLQPFFRYCATCHFTGERFPSNFLSGKASQVAENLRRCAPRMLVRLSAWHTPTEQRVKSPMPPETALRALGTTTQQWASSKELEQLRAYVEQLARTTGQPSEDPEAAQEGYEGLPSCLPSVQ